MADYQSYEGSYSAPAPAVDAHQPYQQPQSGAQSVDGGASFTQKIPAALSNGKVVLRAIQLLCDIIVMGCAASVSLAPFNPSFRQFVLFVSATAFLLDIFFLVNYKFGERFPPVLVAHLPKVELVISAIWSLFYFAGAIAYAVNLGQYHNGTSKTNSVVAFSIFNWLFWGGSTFLAIRRVRSEGTQSNLSYSDL